MSEPIPAGTDPEQFRIDRTPAPVTKADVRSLTGDLVTLVDALGLSGDQRTGAKKMISRIVYGWYEVLFASQDADALLEPPIGEESYVDWFVGDDGCPRAQMVYPRSDSAVAVAQFDEQWRMVDVGATTGDEAVALEVLRLIIDAAPHVVAGGSAESGGTLPTS